MDQSFSKKNLRKVWDLQARRGRDHLGLLPGLRDAYDEARTARKISRISAKSAITYIGPPESAPHALAQAARKRAEDLLDAHLEATSQEIVSIIESNLFVWDLQRGARVKRARDTYKISETPEVFFVDKHLQRVLASLSPNRPRSRHSVVSGLVRTLDNTFPKIVVRTDVVEFYESIDHKLLRDCLRQLGLTPTNRSLIDQLLQEWKALTGRPRGLPTGVGLSSILAELYMGEVDRQLRDDPNTLFYARYVDDIVIVQSQNTQGQPDVSAITARVEQALIRLRLTLNTGKTLSRQFMNGALKQFDFLGYEIHHAGDIHVSLTDERKQKLATRLEKSFAAWTKADPSNHGKRKILLDRIRLLTGNTRLSHNKRNAMVGIYFSNPLVTDTAKLRKLDKRLERLVATTSLPPELKQRIEELSFVDGFAKRTVYQWPTHTLKKIRGGWS